MKLRKFQISCPVFWGYHKYVDIEQYNNLNDIINNVLNDCELFFKSHNLIDLYEFFKSIKSTYHIHDLTFDILLNSNDTDTFYICRHENCNTNMDKHIHNH